jgi:hypothetical protein
LGHGIKLCCLNKNTVLESDGELKHFNQLNK